jgi:hypothetical protein
LRFALGTWCFISSSQAINALAYSSPTPNDSPLKRKLGLIIKTPATAKICSGDRRVSRGSRIPTFVDVVPRDREDIAH